MLEMALLSMDKARVNKLSREGQQGQRNGREGQKEAVTRLSGSNRETHQGRSLEGFAQRLFFTALRIRIVLLDLDALHCLSHIRGLRAFLTFGDFEFHLVSLLQALVTLRTDRAVMNKHVRPICAADEPVSFSVIEPLDGSFQTVH
jgi:hypothetical protein